MPAALLKKVLAARTFNQGFATVEYASSALVDLDLHLLADAEHARRRPPSSAKRSSGSACRRRSSCATARRISGTSSPATAIRPRYYSYLWSEVLDADGFGAFEEAGDIFDPAAAERLHDYVYAAGNRRDPEEAYRGFRGRMPVPEALLRKRGLIEVPVQGEL